MLGSERVAFEAGGDIQGVDTNGTVSRSFPGVNTPADERLPAWTQDGRYLAFLRSERVLLFDFANNMVVDPRGLDIGAQPSGLSIADDPSVKASTAALVHPRLHCTVASGSLLNCRLAGVGHRQAARHGRPRPARGSRVPVGAGADNLRFGRPIRIPLGRVRGTTHVSSRLPRRIEPGRYELVTRTIGRDGHVASLSKPVKLTVKCLRACAG